ncbi:hypothetical protein EV715DRAFT_200573 [Schizophyllum commune]
MAERSAESRPGKRARTEDANPGPIKRSEKIWFDDGNLVVQAEQTQFRVHKSVLAKHSLFFRDLKDLPQPDTPEASVDGCPVVELQDEALAVSFMLFVIYDTAYAEHYGRLKELLLALRMGHKYLVPALFNDAAERLRVYFPTTLEEWDSEDFAIWAHAGEEGFHSTMLELYNVVKRVGHDRSLPMLCLFLLMTFGLVSIPTSPKHSGRLALDAEDRVMLLLGRAKILGTQQTYSLRWMRSDWVNPQCQARKECAKARVSGCVAHLAPAEPQLALFNSFVLHGWGDFSLYTQRMCPSCQEKSESVHNKGRRKFWEDLPSFFGLSPWGELKNFTIE